MKTALLISGHIRSIDKTIENLIELKEKINADIFIHTWSERESSINSWRKYKKYDENIDTNNKYIKILNPKSIEVENPIEVRIPPHINMKITETDPGEKGNTAQGGTKPATLETGLVIQVPLFVQIGDLIRVDTREKKYVERVK